jgi:hypothetical protein
MPPNTTTCDTPRLRGHKAGSQEPYQRRSRAADAEAQLTSAVGVGPCKGCEHAARCRTGLACAALNLYVMSGRVSAVAPRQPDRRIYERLYG